ncbi:hypothetical protein [Phaeobacter sp. HF9A]|uniref:hypothetical protein n=1 Tax=Phaeobacter sp. HF9A TaxID=2721561 RepID=UPI00142FA68E|nr:hypothetical protein [Phaeobacter sp. HF9A]NIZ14724.1 hypothetical protein [Phaeobacter sp. HF9A]
MRIKNIFSLVLIGGLLVACVNNIEAQTVRVTDPGLFNLAKKLVSEKLRDPEATRFKPEYNAYKTSSGDFIVCGTLNGKNAMGGYVGYKPFYVRIRNGQVESFLLPSETDEYGFALGAVRKVCTDAANGKVMLSS